MLSAGDISGYYNNMKRRQRTVPCLPLTPLQNPLHCISDRTRVPANTRKAPETERPRMEVSYVKDCISVRIAQKE